METQGVSDSGDDWFWGDHKRKGLGRPVGEHFASREYCRGSSCDVTTLRRGVPMDGDS